MAADRVIRASDQDRDSAAELLIEAYAVGRLSREELDERAAAAYSAKTWGELRDLTADLPPPAASTGFPAESAASRRSADRYLIGQLTWSFALPLAAYLAVLVSPMAAWVATIVVSIALLAPALRGRNLVQNHLNRAIPSHPAGRQA
jgi:hypothetical protein